MRAASLGLLAALTLASPWAWGQAGAGSGSGAVTAEAVDGLDGADGTAADGTVAPDAAALAAPAPDAPAAPADPAPATSRRAPPSVDELFERGNQAYLHGDYRGAIEAYEQLVSLGIIHEDLYYALGNAYFKADRLGPAILNYERSLSLHPDGEDAQANLTLARQTAAQRWQDKLVGAAADPLWMRVLAGFTPGGLTLAFLSLYTTLFLLVVIIYFLSPGFLRVATMVLLVFVILGTLGAGLLLGGRWWLAERAEFGIVLADEAQVKEGPDASYQTSFAIHGGLRARAVAHDGDWVRLRLPNGLEGWIRDRDFGRL